MTSVIQKNAECVERGGKYGQNNISAGKENSFSLLQRPPCLSYIGYQ